MRPARDRHLLEWSMAALGIGSLLVGAAVQSEPFRSWCGAGTMAQEGPSQECAQDRIAEAQARLQLAAARRADAEHPVATGDSMPKSTGEARYSIPNRPTESAAPSLPPDTHGPEPTRSRP